MRRSKCIGSEWDRCVYLWTVGGLSSVGHLGEVGDVPPVAESKRL